MIQSKVILCLLSLFMISMFSSCSDSDNGTQQIIQLVCYPMEVSGGHGSFQCDVKVQSDREWTAYSENSWIHCNCLYNGEQLVQVSVDPNNGKDERTGNLVVKSGTERVKISVKQEGDHTQDINPHTDLNGNYQLVWHDEFSKNSTGMPNEDDWWYEVWGPGKFNNELQRYVAGQQDGHKVAQITDDKLIITALRSGNEVISARINTSRSWKYGYFEARLKLPKGKGTWPAFWMMPEKAEVWPDCGEIDIMEEVGAKANYVSSSIHCKAYNHIKGTQKTKERYLDGAESEFHIYALEWTESFIRTYIDGKEWFTYQNDGAGNLSTWPFNKAFYVKFNLAWGGDWGGMHGVDETCLPTSYEIDYIRVFQKK